MNGVPTNEREELIAELEGLGYDSMPGVRTNCPDWRSKFSDQMLFDIVDDTRKAIEQRIPRVALPGQAPTPDTVDWPDISELVSAIEQAAIALTLAGEAATAREPITAIAIRNARRACLDIIAQIEAAGAAQS